MDVRPLVFHLPARPTHGAPVRFTRDDVAALHEAGLIDAEVRLELVDGEIFWMGSEGDSHAYARLRLLRKFARHLDETWLCATETSWFPSAISELRPDLAIFPTTPFPTRVAGTSIAIVAEIMATSHLHERERKRPVYAQAGVPELWLIDLDARQTEVFRDPVNGEITTRLEFGPDARFSSLAFPDLGVRLADLMV